MKPSSVDEAEILLRDFALAFPLTNEEFPWGERALKVKGKCFVFLSRHKGFFYVTTKLAASHKEALAHAFAEPSGYGLGKSGWVTCKFAEGDAIPVELLLRFIDESFRLIAPKRVLAELAEGRPSVPARPAKARSPQKAAPKKRKST